MGIPYAKRDPCDDDLRDSFERTLLTMINPVQGVEALIDGGIGFWAEHKKLWNKRDWFSVDTKSKEKLLAETIDRYVMRQKVMLHLMVRKTFAQ